MRTHREPAPYPFDRLPRVARERLPWLRRTSRAIGSIDAKAVDDIARALLGAELTVHPGPLEVCPGGSLRDAVSDPLVAVVLARDDGSLGGRAAVEVDPHFALRCIERALGAGDVDPRDPRDPRDPEDLAPPTTPLTHAERGALAFLAARLLAAAGAPFVVLGVVTCPAALIGALGAGPIAALPASLELGAARGFARAWLPEALLDGAQLFPTGREGFGAPPVLGSLPIELRLDAAWGMIAPAALEGLAEGDAVILDETWLVADGETFRGDLRARIAGARRMVVRCAVEDDGIRVKHIDLSEERGVTEGKRMREMASDEAHKHTDGHTTDGHTADEHTAEVLADRAGDAPIEIALEVARFTMPLAEVTALARGEVLATGTALGGRVTLRANGRAIASGELVDIDGEVGVRVLALAD